MIVDAHTHIFESGEAPGGIPASAEDLIRQMDAAGVDVSIVIPLPGMASNKFVQTQCRRFADRLVALYTPDFTPGTETVRKMAQVHQEQGLRGLKIHPRVQGVTVEDPPVREVLEWAAEAGAPVVIDVFPFGTTVDDSRLLPMAYVRVARELPRLRLILAHAGGHRPLDAFLAAKAFPNICLDVSFTFQYYEGTSVPADLAFVCRRLPSGQLAYGSDFPQMGVASYLERVRAAVAGMGELQQRDLFGETSRRLFGIVGG
jgi:uncharacterized protein